MKMSCLHVHQMVCKANDQHRTENTVTPVRSTLLGSLSNQRPSSDASRPSSFKNESIMHGYKALRKRYLRSSSEELYRTRQLLCVQYWLDRDSVEAYGSIPNFQNG